LQKKSPRVVRAGKRAIHKKNEKLALVEASHHMVTRARKRSANDIKRSRIYASKNRDKRERKDKKRAADLSGAGSGAPSDGPTLKPGHTSASVSETNAIRNNLNHAQASEVQLKIERDLMDVVTSPAETPGVLSVLNPSPKDICLEALSPGIPSPVIQSHGTPSKENSSLQTTPPLGIKSSGISSAIPSTKIHSFPTVTESGASSESSEFLSASPKSIVQQLAEKDEEIRLLRAREVELLHQKKILIEARKAELLFLLTKSKEQKNESLEDESDEDSENTQPF